MFISISQAMANKVEILLKELDSKVYEESQETLRNYGKGEIKRERKDEKVERERVGLCIWFLFYIYMLL